MTTGAPAPKQGYRTIRLPLAESESDRFLTHRASAKARLAECYEDVPAWFPDACPWGDTFFGCTELSSTQPRGGRRMRLEPGGTVWTVAPALVMPAMTGRPHDVDAALFLRRLHGPCGAIAAVCGRDPMSWYRWEQGLGRCRVVGTTVKRADRFPTDVVADATQRWWQGERVSLAPTAGQACLLGASMATSAGPAALTAASGVFAEAAQAVDPDEAPEPVQTDGWQPTQGAWKALWENVTRLLCLLQAFRTSRDRTTQALGAVGQAVPKRVWDAEHAPRKRAFSQRVRRLQAGAEHALPDGAMHSPTLDVCATRAPLRRRDAHVSAPRTSTLVDRWMQCLDRACVHGQYCHGTFESAESRGRALGLLWHFCPSSPETVKK